VDDPVGVKDVVGDAFVFSNSAPCGYGSFSFPP